jgi:hypothetical protein
MIESIGTSEEAVANSSCEGDGISAPSPRPKPPLRALDFLGSAFRLSLTPGSLSTLI